MRLGAVAAAVASVIGLILKLSGIIFTSSPPPPPPSATISGADIGDLVTIREAFGKTPSARTCPDISKSEVFRVSAPASPARSRTQFASLVLTQSPDDGDPPTDTTTGTQTTDDTQTATTPTTSTSAIDPAAVKVVPDVQTVRTPNGQKIIDQIEPKVRSTATDAQADRLKQYSLPLSVAPEGVSQDQRTAVTQEAALDRGTTRSVAQPVGRLIDLTVVLTGLKFQCVQLRWSLYDAKGGVRVKESWLRDRQGLSFVAPSNNPVSASPAFWVPLPSRGGTFFVRMGIFQDDGTRLTFARSPTFSQDPFEPGGA